MKLEVRAEWKLADDACEGGVQKYQYQSDYGEFVELILALIFAAACEKRVISPLFLLLLPSLACFFPF